MESELSFGSWLYDQYKERQKRHPRYSIRAFARDLGLRPGRVVEIFKSQRDLSDEKLKEVFLKLKITGAQEARVRRGLQQKKAFQKISKKFGPVKNLPVMKTLLEEEFSVISDPSYYAVLALLDGGVELQDFPKKLKLSSRQVSRLLEDLLAVGLIRSTADRKFELVHEWVSTDSDRYSKAIREHHRKKLRHALKAIEKVPLTDRDMTSWTFCIDKNKIPEAKKLIAQFQKKLAHCLTSSNQTDVYHFNVQLVPFLLEEERSSLHDEAQL